VVFDADRRVRELSDAADARASAVRAEAEADADRVRSTAREEGHQEGLARAAAVLVAAAGARDRLLAAAEGEVAALALDIARKVLGRHVSGFPEAVVELASRALAEARERREVTLRVHPGDAAPLRAEAGALAAILLRAPLVLREDASVPSGGVVVETEAGRIDARIETQLQQLAGALAEAGA